MTTTTRTVAVFSLGGTIAMTTDPGTGGVVPALSARDLVAAVPGLAACAVTLRVRDFRRLPGASLTIDDLTALCAAIRGELEQGTEGVVVTQGTDTIEETAFLLDLLHAGEAPVVVTGAMRNPTLPGADGPANLYAAVLVAADPQMRGAGCVVVLNDEVHAARTVRKSHTTSPSAFTSPGHGPLARLVEGRIRRTGTRPPRTTVPCDADQPRQATVGIYTVSLGDDGRLLELLDGHCDGLVVAAFGAGHVPQRIAGILEKFASRIPVLLTSRIGNGPVLTQTYSFPGSEQDLLSKGVIDTGDLGPYKARLLLHLLLSSGCSRQSIEEVFAGVADPASEVARSGR
jgi:L-asparaginase